MPAGTATASALIWGERSWTWREIDAQRVGAGGGAGRARHRQGRPPAGSFQELRRDVLVDVCGVPARRGLGADQFPPDAGRGRLSRHRLRRQRVFVPRRFSRPCLRRRRRRARRSKFTWRIGEGAFGEQIRGRGDRGACRRRGRGSPGRIRRSLLVLLHLGHHRPLQGGGADPWPDGFRRDQPSRRPDARHHGERRLAGGGAAVARRRRASTGAGRARRADHSAVHRALRYRRGVPADRDATASATSLPCRPS